MKIALLVDFDLASLLALNHLQPLLEQFEHTVFHSCKALPASKQNQALSDLGEFNRYAIEQAELRSFAQFGSQLMNDINGADFERFKAQRADLVISIRHMSILRSSVIDSAQHGVLNLHSGLLPQYQGVMASFWAMRDGCEVLGTSLHRIEDAKIDTGAIVQRSKIKADYQKSYLWNVLSLYAGGCQNIIYAAQQLASGALIAADAQTGQANYFSYPNQQQIASASFQLFEQQDLNHPVLSSQTCPK